MSPRYWIAVSDTGNALTAVRKLLSAASVSPLAWAAKPASTAFCERSGCQAPHATAIPRITTPVIARIAPGRVLTAPSSSGRHPDGP